MSFIEEFIDVFGLDMIKINDNNYRGACPIHDGDNESSLSIYKIKGVWQWKCFSNDCEKGKRINLPGLIAAMHNIEYQDALKRVKALNGSNMPMETKFNEIIMREPMQQPLANMAFIENMSENFLHKDAVTFYRRHCISKRVVKKHRLGYDVSSQRVIIPIFDQNNRVIGWSGRYLHDNLIGTFDIHGHKIVKYKISRGLKANHVLYNYNNLPEKIDYIIIVEGFKDVWAIEKFGFYVCSPFGHELSAEQLFLLMKKTNKFLVLFDNDTVSEKHKNKNPGQIGAMKACNKLKKCGAKIVKNILMPPDIDPGDCLCNKEYEKRLEKKLRLTMEKINAGE